MKQTVDKLLWKIAFVVPLILVGFDLIKSVLRVYVGVTTLGVIQFTPKEQFTVQPIDLVRDVHFGNFYVVAGVIFYLCVILAIILGALVSKYKMETRQSSYDTFTNKLNETTEEVKLKDKFAKEKTVNTLHGMKTVKKMSLIENLAFGSVLSSEKSYYDTVLPVEPKKAENELKMEPEVPSKAEVSKMYDKAIKKTN